jgi:hypothetical protein
MMAGSDLPVVDLLLKPGAKICDPRIQQTVDGMITETMQTAMLKLVCAYLMGGSQRVLHKFYIYMDSFLRQNPALTQLHHIISNVRCSAQTLLSVFNIQRSK